MLALNSKLCCVPQAMIEAGVAGVHFEDQLSSEKKCGHLGGAPSRPSLILSLACNMRRLSASTENCMQLQAYSGTDCACVSTQVAAALQARC